MDAESPNPDAVAQPPAAAEPPRRRGIWNVTISLAALGAAVAASMALLRFLVSIETSPEEYQSWGGTLKWSAVLSCIVVAAVGGLNWDHVHPAFRRSCRFGAVMAGVSILLASGPFPGGYLAGLLLMISAARFAAAALLPLFELFRPAAVPFGAKRSLAVGTAAFLCTAAAMCAMKLNELGWAYGVD